MRGHALSPGVGNPGLETWRWAREPVPMKLVCRNIGCCCILLGGQGRWLATGDSAVTLLFWFIFHFLA